MTQTGYSWTISQTDQVWDWAVLAPGSETPLLRGHASSRAVAAAMVVRALVRGATEEARYDEGLAA